MCNVIDFNDKKLNRPEKFSQQEIALVRGISKLPADDRMMINHLIKIMIKCNGNLNKEIQMMRDAGLPDSFIRTNIEVWKSTLGKISLT